jgi:hypothetical protein
LAIIPHRHCHLVNLFAATFTVPEETVLLSGPPATLKNDEPGILRDPGRMGNPTRA